jgi:hypothetical protein
LWFLAIVVSSCCDFWRFFKLKFHFLTIFILKHGIFLQNIPFSKFLFFWETWRQFARHRKKIKSLSFQWTVFEAIVAIYGDLLNFNKPFLDKTWNSLQIILFS